MNKPAKLPLEELFALMAPEHARVSRAVYEGYEGLINKIPGSHAKHQAWPGGYISHVEETMNIGLMLHENLTARREVDATQSEVLFCSYLHDFDKLLRYTMKDDGTWVGKPADKLLYLEQMITALKDTYNYELPDKEYNALKYAHGELEADRTPNKRVIWPLGAIVHCADILSARVWHDYGKSHDTWDD